MELTRVYTWIDGHGWEHTTAEREASQRSGSPETIRARSGIFMCGLCGQYVTFTQEGEVKRHFRHASWENDKTCPQRTFGLSGTAAAPFKAREYSLPLRLHFLRDTFKLEIGLLALSQGQLERYSQGQVNIEAYSPEGTETFTYVIGDRIHVNRITYLFVGNKPASSYCINTPDDVLKKYWPAEVEGISERGTLFGSISRRGEGVLCKKLPNWANIQVGEPYILLAKRSVYSWCSHIQIEKIVEIGSWRVYQIQATALERNAAKFFLEQFDYKYMLQEHPVQMYPIWPACVETPYLIFHTGGVLRMCMEGDAELKKDDQSQPLSPAYKCKTLKLFNLRCSDRQQMVALGRMKVLRYAYLRKDSLAQYEAVLPTVEVRDDHDNIFVGGVCNRLPSTGALAVTAPYDGSIVIREGQKITARYELKAEQIFPLPLVRFGQRIEIYQGLDLVWSVSFEQERNKNRGEDQPIWDEEVLLRRLSRCRGMEIEVPHSIGAMGARLERYPRIRQWLYQSVRGGRMSKRALQTLKALAEGAEKCRD